MYSKCKYNGPDPDICIECSDLDYDVDDSIYTNFWCYILDISLDDELQGRI